MIQIREDHMRFISELARYSNSEVGTSIEGLTVSNTAERVWASIELSTFPALLLWMKVHTYIISLKKCWISNVLNSVHVSLCQE